MTTDRAWGLGREVVAGQDLILEGGEERLRGGVVETRPDPPHGLADAGAPAQCGELVSGVGRTPIGVKDHPADRLSATPPRDRHLDRVAGELSVGVITGWVREQPAAVQIQHAGQVELAFAVGISVMSPTQRWLTPEAVKSRRSRSGNLAARRS